MVSEPTLPIKWSVTIGTMINCDGDFDGHGYVDNTCKQALMLTKFKYWTLENFPVVAFARSGSFGNMKRGKIT